MGKWETLEDSRLDLVRAFATTIADSLARVDTDHPAFHGCYDWHSAVHGTYALLAASRLTTDPAYADVAVAVTGESRVRDEEAALAAGRLDNELPYGFAWALILDAEAERAGIGTYRGLATACRDRLVGHLDALRTAGRLPDVALDEEYPNATWAAIALLRWGRTVGDARAVDAATESARGIVDGLCSSAAVDADARRAGRGFYSPVHLAALLAADLGDAASVEKLAATGRLSDELLQTQKMPTVHSAGLNFSRAWGLYGAWRATQDARWRDGAARLVLGHAATPERWRDDYARYRHWVPQFGVFAIAETFDGA